MTGGGAASCSSAGRPASARTAGLSWTPRPARSPGPSEAAQRQEPQRPAPPPPPHSTCSTSDSSCRRGAAAQWLVPVAARLCLGSCCCCCWWWSEQARWGEADQQSLWLRVLLGGRLAARRRLWCEELGWLSLGCRSAQRACAKDCVPRVRGKVMQAESGSKGPTQPILLLFPTAAPMEEHWRKGLSRPR